MTLNTNQILLASISFIMLAVDSLFSWFLWRFSLVTNQNQMNKTSRRISMVIIRHISVTTGLYTTISLATTIISMFMENDSDNRIERLRESELVFGELFYIIASSLLALLLYHRFNHMVTQALGRASKIKRTSLIRYIGVLYTMGLICMSFDILSIFEKSSSTHTYIKICAVFVKSITVIAIVSFLIFSIIGIRREIKKRYAGCKLSWITLNGQFLYFVLIITYFGLSILSELWCPQRFTVAINILWKVFFFIFVLLYLCNDRNFKAYMRTTIVRSPKVSPAIQSTATRESIIQAPRAADTQQQREFLKVCDGCKLPQFISVSVSKSLRGSNSLICNKCMAERNATKITTTSKTNDKNNNDDDDDDDDEENVSVISQIEASELQQQQISTPVKLLLASAFRIKVAQGIMVRETVMADHWKTVSLKRRSNTLSNFERLFRAEISQTEKSHEQCSTSLSHSNIQQKRHTTTRNKQTKKQQQLPNSCILTPSNTSLEIRK